MKRKHNLPDVGKALRIVVMYAKDQGKGQLSSVLAGRNAALEASGRKQEVLEVTKTALAALSISDMLVCL